MMLALLNKKGLIFYAQIKKVMQFTCITFCCSNIPCRLRNDYSYVGGNGIAIAIGNSDGNNMSANS